MSEIRVQITSIERLGVLYDMGITVCKVTDLSIDDAARLMQDSVEFRLVPIDGDRRFGSDDE